MSWPSRMTGIVCSCTGVISSKCMSYSPSRISSSKSNSSNRIANYDTFLSYSFNYLHLFSPRKSSSKLGSALGLSKRFVSGASGCRRLAGRLSAVFGRPGRFGPDRSLRSARDCKELRAFAAPRLRPANRCAIDSLQKARSRAVGLRPLGAALRPGAAAGCRPLRDRFCQHPFPLQLAAAGCRRLRRRICRQFFAAAGCRSLTGSIHCFPSLRDGISSPKSVAAVQPVMRTRT